MNSLPIRLKMLRKCKMLTQEELSKIVKTTPANISTYESGRQKPSLENLLRLADGLECSVDFLLGRKDESWISRDDIGVTKSVPAQELISDYSIVLEDGSAINGEDIEEMLKYIQIRKQLEETREFSTELSYEQN